jgi:UDP:flavonoid glycosyltransferase YjiC (YdhE family)
VRVLFVQASGPSHLYPMVPLAWAFRAAGHEVWLAGKPQFRDMMIHTGLSAVLLGNPLRLAPEFKEAFFSGAYGQQPWPVDWPAHPESLGAEQLRLLELFGRYGIAIAESMTGELITFARRWRPDLIVHESQALSAMIAASLLGVPCVRYSHGTEDAFQHEYRITDGEPVAEFVELFERYGAQPPAGLRAELPTYVDTVPPSMFLGAERPCVPMRYVPFNGPGAVPDGVAGPRQRPRVAVTWGAVLPKALGYAAAEQYREVITAIAGLGVEVLVLASETQLASLDEAPGGVRHLAGAPVNLVLPHCDAIVHHGGEGTSMTAACLGIPQLAITRDPLVEQASGRLAKVGAAIHLRHQHMATAEPATYHRTVRDSVEKLLSDNGYVAAAARLSEDIAEMPPPSAVVDTLVGLAARRIVRPENRGP